MVSGESSMSPGTGLASVPQIKKGGHRSSQRGSGVLGVIFFSFMDCCFLN